jgi:hypothetical protein
MLYEEILKEIQRSLSRQILMLLFFRGSGVTTIEYGNPDDPPTVQGKRLLKLTCKYIFYYFVVKTDCLNHSPHFNVSFIGKSVLG